MEDKARGFGQSVADSLLECDPKDWSRVEKNNGYFFGKWRSKNIQQSLNVNWASNLLQHPQLQQVCYTEMLKNPSFTKAADFDIDTL